MAHHTTGKSQAFSPPGTGGSPPPIYLTILRNGNTNIIDLAEVGSLIPRSETQVDGTFLRELGAEITRLAMLGYSRRSHQDASDASPFVHTTVQDLQQVGELIFSHLLTEPARKKLRTTEPCDLYLRLDEQLIQVPWELCYDGQDFLSSKFRIGRQVITARSIREAPITPRQDGPLRILLIADPTESLPQANIEAERLCTLLDNAPRVEVTLVGGKEVRKVRLLTELQAHDVVHFAGHSYYDGHNPRSSGWRLHDGVLAAGELSKLSRPPLLVFSNSCQAGATAEWDGNPRYEGQAFGIGSAFLLAGVKNFIGTFWVANDEESFFFAATFYQGLTSGSSLGEALLHARQEIIKQKGRESLTWASYMLYGDPVFTLFPTTSVERPSHPLPAPPPQKARPESTGPAQQVQQEQQHASVAPHKTKVPWLSQSALSLKRLTAFAGAVIVLLVGFSLLLKNIVSSKSPPPLMFQAYEQAFADLRAGRVGAAQAAFQRLTINPDNAVGLGYDGLAAIALEQGFLDKAKEVLQKSLTANPANPANPLALLTQGDIYYSAGENEHARAAYQQATEARAVKGWQKALAYNAFGVCVALAGRDVEAKGAFERALVADEKSYEAASNLGYLSWRASDLSEARRWFTKALQSQPGDELARTFLEEILPAMSSSLPPKTVSKVLIIPFASRVGLPRRLGEGDVFAWKLTRALAPTIRAEILSQDLLQGKRLQETSSTYDALINLAKKKRVPFLVIGKLASFSATLFIRGQVIITATATEKTLDHVERAENGRFETAARVLAGQIAHTDSEAKPPQGQGEAEWSPTPALSHRQLDSDEKKASKPERRNQEKPQRSSQSSWRQWIYQDLPSRDERNWPWRK